MPNAATLFVNIFDEANEEAFPDFCAMEWPTGATLPLLGEVLQIPGYDDFQVVRRVFHLKNPLGLVVDLFVLYSAHE
jgi:hypothetical protein